MQHFKTDLNKILIFISELRENRLYFSYEVKLRLHLTVYRTTVWHFVSKEDLVWCHFYSSQAKIILAAMHMGRLQFGATE